MKYLLFILFALSIQPLFSQEITLNDENKKETIEKLSLFKHMRIMSNEPYIAPKNTLVAHELNVEQFWRGYFGARRGARSEYSGSYINDEQQSMATKEAAKKVKHLVREPLVAKARHRMGQIKTGEKVPQYIFKEILNGDKKPFDISTQGKPLILEFWATWCAPCIPAMKELEIYQNKFGDQLEILTISTDKVSNLLRYIDNTKTSLKIAYDSSHQDVFNYRYIPHTILIDKKGIIKAITTPDMLTEKIIADFIAGKEIELKIKEDKPTNLGLFKEYKNQFYQYTLTSENKNLSFKNEIKRNENNEPISLEFNNVSIYRLLTDIYELTTAARLDVNFDSLSTNKYCFRLEQSAGYSKNILDNAKEILNENSGFKARFIEKTIDSLYTLQVIDSTRLPGISLSEKHSMEFGGPNFKGIKITANHLIIYLENITLLPVKDKTGINFVFDMDLDWSYENPKTLNEELKKYGLQLQKSNVPEKIVLLEIK